MIYKWQIVLMTLLLALITGCSIPPTEKACQLDTLLLRASSFPGNIWEEIGSRDSRGAPSKIGIDRVGTSFSTPAQGVTVQIIYKFATVADAKENYAQLELDWFNLAPEGSVWVSPDELKNVRLNSDDYRLDCSIKKIETCRFVARYGNHIVELKTDMPAIAYPDLIHLLDEIDQNMLMCIDK